MSSSGQCYHQERESRREHCILNRANKVWAVSASLLYLTCSSFTTIESLLVGNGPHNDANFLHSGKQRWKSTTFSCSHFPNTAAAVSDLSVATHHMNSGSLSSMSTGIYVARKAMCTSPSQLGLFLLDTAGYFSNDDEYCELQSRRHRQKRKTNLYATGSHSPSSSSIPESSSSRTKRRNHGKPSSSTLRSKGRNKKVTHLNSSVTGRRTNNNSNNNNTTRRRRKKSFVTATATEVRSKSVSEHDPELEMSDDLSLGRVNRNVIPISERSSSSSVTTGAWYQRDEITNHDILSKEDEFRLGNQILRAKDLREQMIDLICKRTLSNEHESYGNVFDLDVLDTVGYEDWKWDEDASSLWMVTGGSGTDTTNTNTFTIDNDNNEDTDHKNLDMNMDMTSLFSQGEDLNGMPIHRNSPSFPVSWDNKRISSVLVNEGSKLSAASLDAYVAALTDEEITNVLKIEGGRKELCIVLHQGSEARTKLMRSNLRLVVSIAKKWMGRSLAAGTAEGSRLRNLYDGGWGRPSLDEAIQEGVLGLARAVDKFQPERGLRFSTYSTHWITNYVRQCFQVASTGCLKVPSQLHAIKNSYKSIIKRQIELSEPIPTEEMIAAEIGVTIIRLRTAIRVTESLLSIDQPVYQGGSAAYKGSGAGGDLSGDNNLLMSDSLQCSETAPEDFVEISFLRQCLENAMAAELSPHERDVLRLRLGLDDGQTRTVKEVVEVCGGGLSTADVRSAERRAFKKLRSPNSLHTHNLLAYLEIAGIDFEAFQGRS